MVCVFFHKCVVARFQILADLTYINNIILGFELRDTKLTDIERKGKTSLWWDWGKTNLELGFVQIGDELF